MLVETRVESAGKSGAVWDVRPFQIVSLYEMVVKFEAGEIYQDVLALRLMLDDLGSYIRRYSGGKYLDECPELKQSIRTRLNGILVGAKRYPLARTVEAAEDLHQIDPDIKHTSEMLGGLQKSIQHIQLSLEKDLWEYLFLFVPKEDAKYYEQEKLFGAKVKLRFPKANQEITSAGSCYATGNYTACVFHLMRAVEIGARTMIQPAALNAEQYLKHPLELCDWQELLDALDDGVEALRPGSRGDTAKKQKLEDYNHAVGVFRNFKDAWRNKVSHARHVYKPGETIDCMDSARQFMKHLAETLKLKEPKKI